MQRKDPSATRGPRPSPTPIGEAIRQFLRQSGLQRPSGDERAFRAWTDAAGPDWGRHAVPVSFRAGELVIEVGSSVRLSELKNYHAEGYRKKANASLGEPLIKKVVIKLKS